MKLIEQICRKLRKEKTLEKIADELENHWKLQSVSARRWTSVGWRQILLRFMRRCKIRIDLDERPEYHKVYRLRDETGHELSDILEIHVIELNKPLSGTGRMDDWIRLFNAMTEEELKMLEAGTKNAGILEAIKEVRVMSLRKHLRLLHEARQKEIRDRAAREDYVRSEGRGEGLREGLKEGLSEGLREGRSEGEDRFNRLYGRL